MKVLHVISGLRRGGAETAMVRQITASRTSVTHHVVSLTDGSVYGPVLEKAGILVSCLDMRGPLDMIAIARKLVQLIEDARPDVVHTWMYHADFMGGLAGKWVGVPVIWGIRSGDLKRSSTRATRVLQRICALISRRVPCRIVCVAESARKAHAAVGYDDGRMTVVPNGYDLADFHERSIPALELRRRLGIAEGDIVVGCIGRFDPAKDYQGFTQACAELAPVFPLLRFLLVGPRVTNDNAMLCGWIDATGNADRFLLVGEQADIPLYLAAMDIFCLPSRTEAFPNVVVEAMLMARPCVVTDVGDAALMVGDAGVVVPPESPSRLAAGLSAVLRLTTEARNTMGKQANERARAQYSMETMIGRIGSVYDAAIESCRNRG